MVIRVKFSLSFLAVVLVGPLSGCGIRPADLNPLPHITNISAAPDVEVVGLPPLFAIDDASSPHPGSWVKVSSNAARWEAKGTEPFVFDLSPFLAIDPYLGPWNPPLPTQQAVFVKSSEAARVKLDRDGWNERFVIELAVNSIDEPQRGTSMAERLSFTDPARVLCHKGVMRQMLSSTAVEAIYESKFTDCPQFGPDRVVLTRDVVGNWDAIRHSQGIFSFSYESKGDRLTQAQRAEGMKLIQAPHLVMATQEGEKHPLWRDEQLRFITESTGG